MIGAHQLTGKKIKSGPPFPYSQLQWRILLFLTTGHKTHISTLVIVTHIVFVFFAEHRR